LWKLLFKLLVLSAVWGRLPRDLCY